MKHRGRIIRAIEEALTTEVDGEDGEVALVILVRNWLREAMDPASPNYKFALAEWNKYTLGTPEQRIHVEGSGSGIRMVFASDNLAQMGVGKLGLIEQNDYGEREVRVIEAQTGEGDG